MLNRLSHYKKEIAINLLTWMMVSMIMPFTANASLPSMSYAGRVPATVFPTVPIPMFSPSNKNFDLPKSTGNTVVSTAAVVTADHKGGAGSFSGTDKKFIGGPGQPEMSAFKSVNADNMVDLFSGDFSYNIPLLDVGGYPVNLFYNGGITMDQSASWVGLGFNINPGTIMRNMRGLPDDFDGTDLITKTQSMKPDLTWGVNAGAGLEGLGIDRLGLSVNGGLSFNNQRGLALEYGIHPSISISKNNGDDKTAAITYGAGLNLSVNSQSGASITPSINLQYGKADAMTGSFSASLGYHSRMGIQSLHLDGELSKSTVVDDIQRTGTLYAHSSSISFAYPSVMPSVRTVLTRKNFNVSLKFGGAGGGFFGHPRIGGFYSQSKIAAADKVTTHPAYGVLYYQQANEDKKAMLDFNRLNDGVFSKNSPVIALPVYTYDVFSISGEGTGGSFRAYRGDLGYVRDGETKTRDDAGTLGLEFGAGGGLHGGVNMEYVFTPTTAGAWTRNNFALNNFGFKKSAGSYQAVYFKNPGEKAIPDVTYQNAIGGEDLVRLKLINQSTGTPAVTSTLEKFNETKYKTGDLPVNSADISKKRDKRGQVITSLTAEEAARIGFDKKIYSYDPASPGVLFGRCDGYGIKQIERFTGTKNYAGIDNYRKQNHISEINVLNEDGRRYVYGLPVYNKKETDVTFNISNGNLATLLSSYAPGKDDEPNMSDRADDAFGNTNGKDWYMEKQEMPAYTHSFLLTALVSPNYVDVKGDGITEDDMGDAVKFNYSQFEQGIKWRTPTGQNNATWSEGMKTDNKDDKAHYIYGEREQWYLYSVESKNMVARFYVANDRKDEKQVLGQAGGIDATWGAQRLTKISLFSKGDLVKKGTNAKPIKTVYFEYSYKLCKGVPGSIGTTGENGKLTLESIYFTYNGNERQKKNRYKFSYTNNPDYDYNANDRWGNYKPKTDNPDELSNADYSYSIQDKIKADQYAAAWMLDQVTLPSGGKINIAYEADDYSFVQNKRASVMYSITGFGNTETPTVQQQANTALYTNEEEFDYIYASVPFPITATTVNEQQRELAARYFSTKSSQLFMKLAVTMPADNRGSGSELVPMYADIDKYGVIPNTGGYKIFIKVRRLESGSTPMVQYALQFMKNFLAFKAYPGYDVSETGALRSVMMALAGMRHNVQALFKGEDKVLKKEKKCKRVVTERSFVRLTNPYLFKYGGGHRVKKVVLSDNWNKLSGGYDATYGQEYKYTSSELVNGVNTVVSSGVASWEPSIGGEENTHREIVRYLNRNKGGPFDYGSVELPIAEMFFPSPSVGYSRVEVLSIHRDTVKNAPGKTVTEYFTTRDFPTKSDYTSLADGSANVQYQPKPILQLLKLDLKQAITVSQGFRVVLNDMNGKLKSQAAYSAFDMINPISFTRNYYNASKASDDTYQFNHNFSTLNGADGVIAQQLIGRDVEVMTDFREHKMETITTNVNFNVDFFLLGIFPITIPTWFSPTFYESNTFRSAAMLKVVNHYAVLDSVVSIDKGSMVSTKNLVFDAETGNALVSRTQNEHNLPQFSFSYPAHWAYPGMGLAYKNIDVIYDQLRFRNGLLETTVDMSVFESGDELYVVSASDRGPLKDALCDGIGTGPNAYLPKSQVFRIWAVNTAKTGSLTPQFVFIDAEGNPYTAENVKMRIVRSGKRNLLDQGVGGVTTMNNPIRQIGLFKKIILDDETGILQSSAASFKDHWRVDNILFRKDSVVKSVVYGRVKKMTIYPEDYVNTHLYQKTTNAPVFSSTKDNTLSLTKRSKKGNFLSRSEKWYQRSHVLYDYSVVPANARFYKAFLSLFSHTTENSAPLHPGLHGNSLSQTTGLPAEIRLMKSSWYPVTNASAWGTNYLTSNQYLSSGSAILPPSATGNENYSLYTNAGRVDISSLLAQNTVTTLGAGKKIGLQLKLFNDDVIDGGNTKFRCFWSASPGKPFASAQLTYYYYICGDTSLSGDYYMDPLINTMIPCNSYDSIASFCLSKFTHRKSINPYVEGIWGNWRVDTSFVYYGDRKETDPAVAIDTRKAGLINNFKPFWNFSALFTSLLERNFSASDVWVWNSTITQYNRKGYETENKDALGRFNAGLYGYSQQLPVAVANNSRYREIMFDGFEDYDYQTASCSDFCKPRRNWTFENAAAKITDTLKHTGRYSLRVDAGQTISLKAPVVSLTGADLGYSMRVRVDSVSYTTTVVTPAGNGISGRYLKYSSANNNSAMMNAANMAIAGILGSSSAIARTDTRVDLQQSGSMQPPFSWGKFVARWDGFIQALETGTHYFRTLSNDGIRVWIHNGTTLQLIIDRWTPGTLQGDGSITLTKGQTYAIRIEYCDTHAGGQASLLWKNPLMSGYDLVPKEVFYLTAAAAANTVTTPTRWCTKFDYAQVQGNALTDTLSLIKERKMLVSAWVKENNTDCKCASYVNNNISISFTGAANSYIFKPSGSIIEGWQRYEAVVDIPLAATQMTLQLNNTTNVPVYFDDIRLHPFNANMKSFVYHSSSLRLLSELDENNYASFYEYDDDGTLIRVKKETEKGIKTITETRSALQKIEE